MSGDEVFTIVFGAVVCVGMVCNAVIRVKTAKYNFGGKSKKIDYDLSDVNKPKL